MEISKVVGSSYERPESISRSSQKSFNFKETLDEIQKRRELEKERLSKAARDIEALFIEQMIKALRSTIHREDDPLYGGHAEEIFQGMLDKKYSELISDSSSLGLATQIYNQMLRHVK